jgi:hypothetical protein
MAGYQVFVRGIPHLPSVREVNARAGAGTHFAVVEKVTVGTDVSRVTEIRSDAESKGLNGKLYTWFKVRLSSGIEAWIRDDLLDLLGDCTPLGYEVYPQRTFAFAVQRSTLEPGVQPSAPVPSEPVTEPAVPVVGPLEPPPVDEMERIRRAAFAISAAFEGSGYAAFQNYDAGIISFGRFQYTLGAGTLATVVNRFLDRSQSAGAEQLRAYRERIQMRDESLRHDAQLKQILISVAFEPEMMKVQDEVATEGYWERMLAISAQPRGLRTPLGLALVFDIAINFGVLNRLLGLAEEDLGVLPKSRLGANGISEEQFLVALAERRRRGHYMQAERDNLPGLKRRGDFWVDLANRGDWGLQGNSAGFVYVNGKPVQVRTPSEF